MALPKNKEGAGGKGMLSIPKPMALMGFHCSVTQTPVAAGFPHCFLLLLYIRTAVNRDLGELDTVV